METKKCSKCKRELPRDTIHFRRASQHKDGLYSSCKECDGNEFHESRIQPAKPGHKVCYKCQRELPLNRDHFRVASNKKSGFAGACRECRGLSFWSKVSVVENGKKNCTKCGEIKDTSEFHKASNRLGLASACKQCMSDYVKSKACDYRDRRNRYEKERMKNDVEFRIYKTIKKRINNAIAKDRRVSKYTELLGCSVAEFKVYLESLFKEGMTWDTHGHDTWHYDHIKPCAMFDMEDPEQQKECFNYTNYQPLWAYENWSKNAKYNGVDYVKRGKQLQ